MNKLNPPQREAVRVVDRHMLVLAGAGSGKTRVITEKIAHLLKEQTAEPDNLVAVTFTNKAAQEMRKRIAARVGNKTAAGVSISTFHTLGLTMLRAGAVKLGYKRGFSIFDAQDSQAVLQELLRENSEGYAGDERRACWQISGLKSALLTPEQALKQSETGEQHALARLYGRYQRQLQAYNAMDFDDLIRLPVQLLTEDEASRSYWHERVRFLLVDEYQDTNVSQYELVRLLLGGQARLTAVGDDDQSIYAWRGARSENLKRLSDDFPDLHVIKLEQNYRSMGRILKCANALIAHNPHFFEKRLWSELGYGDPVRVLTCNSPEDEAERVVSEILHLKFQHRCKPKDFAILYRSNHQSRLFEGALRMHDIPYKVSGGTAFFERAEIKDLLAYLRLIVNQQDDAAFLRVINTPRREIGAATLEKLGALAGEHSLSLFEAIEHPSMPHVIASASRNRLLRFADWINELEQAGREQNATPLLSRVTDDIAYDDWLLNTCKDKTVAETRMKNVQDLKDWVHKVQLRNDNAFTLDDLVGRLSLMDIIERNETEKENDAVQLMTFHAAKGLEFPYVFMVGVEEGILPHQNSETDEAVEEERRLAYVGMTRAQRSLAFSFASKRRKQGETVARQPSRFLSELPADELEWDGQDERPVEEKLARGNANLASLRDLLNNA